MNYKFKEIESCNMCRAAKSRFKTMGKRLNTSQGKNPRNKIGIATTVVKCLDCGLIFPNPQPIPEDTQDHYRRSPQDYWKEPYFTISDNYFSREINRLRMLMNPNNGARALDIGAGIGKCMRVLEKEGFCVHGIEPSELFYQRAIQKMGISPQKLKLTSIESADFEEDFFDFVTFGASLEHMYDPSESIRKALKWLKPGGLIHIEVPSSAWLVNKIANFYYKMIGTDYVANISPMHKPYHLYEFSFTSFKKNAEINNCKIVHREHYVCQTYMPKILDVFLKPLMKYTNTGMQLCIWLTKE